jgi:hypothetical protein
LELRSASQHKAFDHHAVFFEDPFLDADIERHEGEHLALGLADTQGLRGRHGRHADAQRDQNEHTQPVIWSVPPTAPHVQPSSPGMIPRLNRPGFTTATMTGPMVLAKGVSLAPRRAIQDPMHAHEKLTMPP